MNCLTVQLNKIFEDEVNTPSGIKFYRDTFYRPEWNATITGTVVAVPKRIKPTLDRISIVPEATPGDTVIFSYLVVYDREQPDEFQTIYLNRFEVDDKPYWKVDYNLVLGYIRDGELVPASGYMFLEPASVEEVEKKTAGGIIIPEMSQKKTHENVGVITAIGIPGNGQPTLSVKKGDSVLFDKRFVEQYTINDKDFWVLRQERALAKVN